MCHAFSCLVSNKGKVYWKLGMNSHDALFTEFELNESSHGPLRFAKIEIVPDNKEKYPYLHPDKPWKLVIDERVKPDWICPMDEQLAWDAWQEWKGQLYSSFNLDRALNPVHPFKVKPCKVTKKDIANLKKWSSVRSSVRDSVWDSVGDSVWSSVRSSVRDGVGDSVWDSVWSSVRNSVGDSVWDSVGDSVWAYIGSCFLNIKQWKYIEHKDGEYPFQPAVELWERGFVPSFDDTTWRLYSGEKAQVVYEWKPEKVK